MHFIKMKNYATLKIHVCYKAKQNELGEQCNKDMIRQLSNIIDFSNYRQVKS